MPFGKPVESCKHKCMWEEAAKTDPNKIPAHRGEKQCIVILEAPSFFASDMFSFRNSARGLDFAILIQRSRRCGLKSL